MCAARFKSNSWWEWLGSAMLALPVIVALALWFFWRLPGWSVFVVSGVMLALGVVFFPYLTKFDLKDETRDHTA
jgi:predicted membrane channel-forming protein YqfA (hemolysin III family)